MRRPRGHRAIAALLVSQACTGNIEGQAPPAPTRLLPAIEAPVDTPHPTCRASSPQRIRRLSAVQFEQSVHLFTGAELDQNPFAGETVPARFSTSAEALQMDASAVATLRPAAEVSAHTVLERDLEAKACAASVRMSCVRQLFARYLPMAWRRPAESEEVERFAALVVDALPALGGPEALELGLAAVLSSPEHLFRFELGEPAADEHGRHRLTRYEIAAMLAFDITAAPPSAQLLAAAESGELDTAAGVRSRAEMLLADDATRLSLATPSNGVKDLAERSHAPRDFLEQYLGYPAAAGVAKNESIYPRNGDVLLPQWDGARRAAETARFVTFLLRQRVDFIAQLFTSDAYFATEQRPGGFYGGGEAARSGILTQPSILGLLAQPDQTDPVRRGKYIMENFLCLQVPPLPINGVPPLVQDPNLTLRERLAVHSASPDCKACHQLMDPLGLGLEAFDSVGYYRETELGRPVDASGVLVNTGEQDGPFVGAAELGERLAHSRTAEECFARHALGYFLGRDATGADADALEQAQIAYRVKGDWIALLASLFGSESFLYRSTPGAPCD